LRASKPAGEILSAVKDPVNLVGREGLEPPTSCL
jgi:hypothetical protein